MKDSFISTRLRVTQIIFAFALALPCTARPIDIAGGKIDLVFPQEETDAQPALVLDWITNAARAVAKYYGHFPVAHLVIRLHAIDGDEIGSGQTHGTRAGDDAVGVSVLQEPIPKCGMRHIRSISKSFGDNWESRAAVKA